jgi:hypothetical protein
MKGLIASLVEISMSRFTPSWNLSLRAEFFHFQFGQRPLHVDKYHTCRSCNCTAFSKENSFNRDQISWEWHGGEAVKSSACLAS